MSENRSCEQPPDHHFVFRAGMPVSDIDRDNICPPPIQLTVDGPSRSTVRSGRRLSPSRVGVALDARFLDKLAGTDGLQTLRWREQDSNPRSLSG
jgi:hypothetical protein